MPSSEEVEAAAEAEYEHVRAGRPHSHGPYPRWDEAREEYRDYCRAIARVGLEAARRVREDKP